MSLILFSTSKMYGSENHPGKEANATNNSESTQKNKIEETCLSFFSVFPCVVSDVMNHPLPSNHAGQQKEKEESPGDGWWGKLWDDPIALFTALLFFATLALFWATYRLVAGADLTAERQLRAYVFVSLADGEKLFLDENGCLSAPLIIKNYGQTPAYNLKCSVFIGPCKLPLAEILDPPNYTGGSVGCLPHNQAHRQYPTVLRPLTETEIEGITSGKYGMFVWGYLEYKDIFKSVQNVQFRMVSSGADFARGELAYCNEGNEAT